MKTRIFLSLCLFWFSSGSLAGVIKAEKYNSFSITSKKINKEMSDEYIINNLMCRSTQVELEKNLDLLKNYDLVDSDRTDGSMVMTTFAGKSNNKTAKITLLIDSKTHVLFELWVNDNEALKCDGEIKEDRTKSTSTSSAFKSKVSPECKEIYQARVFNYFLENICQFNGGVSEKLGVAAHKLCDNEMNEAERVRLSDEVKGDIKTDIDGIGQKSFCQKNKSGYESLTK